MKPDVCGKCNGGGIPKGDCDCFGHKLDCFGNCGGNVTRDECKVCGGHGILPH